MTPTPEQIVKRLIGIVTYYEIGENKRVGDEYRVRQFLNTVETQLKVDADRIIDLEKRVEKYKNFCYLIGVDYMERVRGGI